MLLSAISCSAAEKQRHSCVYNIGRETMFRRNHFNGSYKLSTIINESFFTFCLGLRINASISWNTEMKLIKTASVVRHDVIQQAKKVPVCFRYI
jgi:hypothetical protein